MNKLSPRSRLAIMSAGVAVTAILVSPLVGASDTAAPDTNSACHNETRRVAVWSPGGPRAQQVARFEERSVRVCDGEIVSEKTSELAPKSKG